MVLIPKSVGGYRGIVLVEVIWKVCLLIMNNRIQQNINLHDALHGFRQGRGMGTATMEAKLTQKLVRIVHEQLFQVFIDMWKA